MGRHTRTVRRYTKKGRRRSTRMRQRRVLRGGGATPVVIGKIYSNLCGHCQAMAQAWEEMERELPQNKFEIWNIEAGEEATKKAEFKHKYGVDLVSNGYPTIFNIVNGKQVDYNGERDRDSLIKWANSTM